MRRRRRSHLSRQKKCSYMWPISMLLSTPLQQDQELQSNTLSSVCRWTKCETSRASMIAEDQGGGTQHQATELSECLSVCMLLTFSINLSPCRHHYCWYISHIYRFSIYLSNSLSLSLIQSREHCHCLCVMNTFFVCFCLIVYLCSTCPCIHI